MIEIPRDLLPHDGRFGSGPAKIRSEALTALGTRHDIMGTSHRGTAVVGVVAHVQEMLRELYTVPDDYEVVLGNGGATFFWDVACASLIENRSSHAVCGVFSKKFATEAMNAPHLAAPYVRDYEIGTGGLPSAHADADVYAWAHNETSTGVLMPASPVDGADPEALHLVDATSAAGGIPADVSRLDAYYFSTQKNFSADGGLWVAIVSPRALARAKRLTRDKPGQRWVPEPLNLTLAAQRSAKHQTINTPAIATLLLLESQLEWLLSLGGIEAAAARSRRSSGILYAWAEGLEHGHPFVAEAMRSPVVGTIDFDDHVDADELVRILADNGIRDVNSYRSLHRNQIRVGMFPSVDPDDVERLTAAIDWVLGRITR